MPTYAYVCRNCGFRMEQTVPLAKRNERHECMGCDAVMSRDFKAPHIAPIGGLKNRLNSGWRETGKVLYGDNEHVPQVQRSK